MAGFEVKQAQGQRPVVATSSVRRLMLTLPVEVRGRLGSEDGA
jgi:hypothetical protein